MRIQVPPTRKNKKLGRSTLSRGWPKQGLQVLLFWLLTGNLTLENPTNLLVPRPSCSNVGQVRSSQVGSMTPDHHLSEIWVRYWYLYSSNNTGSCHGIVF